MKTNRLPLAALLLPFCLAGCDMGTYTPGAHHQAQTSTGSLLTGTNTEPGVGGDMHDPSLHSAMGVNQASGH